MRGKNHFLCGDVEDLRSFVSVQRTPSVETIENIMKLSAMLVQATWDNKSPLLQLPHFSDEILRHCVSKKVKNVDSEEAI